MVALAMPKAATRRQGLSDITRAFHPSFSRKLSHNAYATSLRYKKVDTRIYVLNKASTSQSTSGDAYISIES